MARNTKAHPNYIREKARSLRLSGRELPIICQMLNIPKTTVYGWIKDMEITIQRTKKQTEAQLRAAYAVKKKWKIKRDIAYQNAYDNAKQILTSIEMRDFILIYMCEGYRKSPNTVQVSNSNGLIIKLCYGIIKTNTDHKIRFQVQYHEDQNIKELDKYWSTLLDIPRNTIYFLAKSNSGKMKGRNWNSKYGVMAISTSDTYLKCKIDALSDYVQEQWIEP